MYREDGKSTDNLYENYVIRGKTGKDSTQGKSSEVTGSDSVKIRNYRAAVVCLVLLCVLLLTAVIVLCVTLTQERQQLISKNENLTNEREQLTLKIANLNNDREQLRTELHFCVNWTRYQSSFYYMSKEKKNWTESRRYCTERGADLIIINNREEQDFIHNRSGNGIFYIGLTDSEVEGTWKWVDNTTHVLTSGFWVQGEPNAGQGIVDDDCVVTVAVPPPEWGNLVGWLDVACNKPFQWICEKRISQFILP
ncbi:C-type lectin domain family 10 member A-like isoform X3 [Carassius gibelio]|uniref:C-type lectin domain family 10 member A-like isoform X3 n=1 Tax=Carassius gibelio TaxID=101364 RepID=UPI00227780C1|nr:C-type lectin domain family 10 member A-like isoform X3 [Carassius gibelio]